MILTESDCAAIAERVADKTALGRPSLQDVLDLLATVAAFRQENATLEGSFAMAEQSEQVAQQQVAALREVLETYGTHTEECRVHLAVRAIRGTGIDVSCNCGLDAALHPGGTG